VQGALDGARGEIGPPDGEDDGLDPGGPRGGLHRHPVEGERERARGVAAAHVDVELEGVEAGEEDPPDVPTRRQADGVLAA
jgi:hypothetical protein